MKRFSFGLCVAAVAACTMVVSGKEPAAARPLKGERVMRLLKPGAVKPTGWLRDRALAMKGGYTGHSHEYHEDFKKSWTKDLPKHFWPYECGAYWLDGLARLAYQLDDPELIALTKERTNHVLSNMHENAILFYYFMDRTNEKDVKAFNSNPFYIRAAGQYARALWAYYQASGDERVLRAFKQAYSGEKTWLQGVSSIKGISAIMEAYEVCGGERNAAMFDNLFDRDQVRRNWPWHDYLDFPQPGEQCFLGHRKGMDWARWHGVMMSETLGSLAMGTLWTGSSYYLEKSLAWRDLINATCEQVHGTVVCDEHLARPGAYKTSETCVVAGQMWDDILFLSLTGKGRFADHIEKMALNAAPVCTTRDGTQHVYYQAPNRVVNSKCGAPGGDGPGIHGIAYSHDKHLPRCCMAALNRLLPFHIQSLWMEREGGVAAVLYGPCTLETDIAGAGNVRIVEETVYPFEETVRLSVETEKTAQFPLWLRMPLWCAAPFVRVNGKEVTASACDGFMKIDRTWKTGDKVELVMPQQVRLLEGIDVHAGDVPYAAVTLGPLTMALSVEGADQNTHREGADWQFALDKKTFSAKVERSAVKSGFDWPRDDSPVKVAVNLVGATWQHDQKSPKLPKEMTLGGDRTVTLIPYASARMRVSMFPVANRAAAKKSPVAAATWNGAFIEGRTAENKLFYAPGEKMTFEFFVRGKNLPENGKNIRWERTGDDGKVEKGMKPVSKDGSVKVETSLDRPGFVRMEAFVCDDAGTDVAAPGNARGKVYFAGGAGVEPEKIAPPPEPEGFDEWWRNHIAELKKVPMNPQLKEYPTGRTDVKLYEFSVGCAGGRPCTGWLAVPTKEGKYPMRVNFFGYNASWSAMATAVRGANELSDKEVRVWVSAHGFEHVRGKEYYEKLRKEVSAGYDGHAWSPKENARPETSYFAKMAWRVLRGLEFAKSRPEWDGRKLTVAGGSQGAMQSIWAAAWDPAVTDVSVFIVWNCDAWGKAKGGRIIGDWVLPWAEGLRWFDSVTHASRIRPGCNVNLGHAGLGDYISPPSGIAALYNALKTDKRISWIQGAEHVSLPKWKNPQRCDWK